MAQRSILRLARYAPKDGRVFIGVYRPPFETETFYSTFRWDEARGKLPFGLHMTNRLPGLRSPVKVLP